MTTQYTPTEKLHTCQTCTLANAMKLCTQCQFYTQPKRIKHFEHGRYFLLLERSGMEYTVELIIGEVSANTFKTTTLDAAIELYNQTAEALTK